MAGLHDEKCATYAKLASSGADESARPPTCATCDRPQRQRPHVAVIAVAVQVMLLAMLLTTQIPKAMIRKVPVWLGEHNHDKDCDSASFTQETLKLVGEEVVVKLAGGRDFDDDPLSKFEASGIEASPDRLDLACMELTPR